MACLTSLGAEITARQWGLGGSQTLETTRAYLGKDLIVIEAETYVGLSIQGEGRIVERIKSLLSAKTSGDKT